MRSAALAATGLFALLATAAVAQGSGASSGPAAQSPRPKADEVVCRRVQESGSLARRPGRCYTRAQWDRLAEDSRNTGSTAATGSASGN